MAKLPRMNTWKHHFDEPAVRGHVAMIHSLAKGVEGVLVITPVHVDPVTGKDSVGGITHHSVGDIEGMVDAVMAHSLTPNVNVYTGLQVMRKGLHRGKRGTAADIVAVLGIVVDQDGDKGLAGSLPAPAQYALETSPGNAQPFFLFDRPVAYVDARALLAAMKRACGDVDHGTTDAVHIWRIAGTLNWPNKVKLERGRSPEPYLVTAEQEWEGDLCPVAALRAELDPWMMAIAESRSVAVCDLPDIEGIKVSPRAAELLAASDVGDRSAHAARVVEQLAFDDHTPEEACALFMSAPGDWFERYQTEDRARTDFERMWSKPIVQDHIRGREEGERLAASIREKARARLDAANDDQGDISIINDDEAVEYQLEAVADLESLTYPGGLLQDLVDWIVSSAEQPSRTLALAAVLPFIASLAGARYSTGSRDTRPNMYTVALAESGFGKEHARSQIKRILMADHGVFEDFSGPARIMSASALREVLERHSSVNCQIDEFGGFVREITDRKAGGHQRAISTDLRDYYSASSTFFEGAAYRGTPPKRIYNPNLCIHGTSTPDQFWSALSSASAEDGLLPRLILFHAMGEKPESVKPTRDVRNVPFLLMERMAKVAGIDIAARRSAKLKVTVPAWGENKPHVIPWTDEATAVFGAVKDTIDSKERLVAPENRPFVRRIVENAIKLAMVNAIGIDPVDPVITEDIFEWAASVAWTCAAAMLIEVGERLADNQREANYKKIAALIRKAAMKGLTEGRLADRCKAIDARQRDEIIKDLLVSGKVVLSTTTRKTGPKTRTYLWAA